ncbi:anaerobic glycerol-3-phosphate dehydrogenase subunit GlpB [Pectinatus cerevisiiphilus]|uniref:Glycerol 3-phosphate dehydrogenase (Quinone) subunit B n=1 Tax=Pectinatus cerevisiiphilus TaxID=86956 RepID=A0A4R3K7L7_9FIRM|nr:anaerobic glycerol-3-phosphate dehydrogenase subunit GlpB [Pectinatus cerevisiiphilus]TCS78956.1 glycerol 3-phosphate dehydrogenase (quinone) subunit B [Pectinatus cerevisiiphilus]
MKKCDILIIGNGVAGLFAACVAADRGKKVQILSYGAGTLTIGGGIIDVLGYDDQGKFVSDPLKGMESMSPEHPYAKTGPKIAKEAIDSFLKITEAEGYPYLGSADKNMWLPTAMGNFKPTCLVPRTMDASALFKAKNILVVGFDTMKDFYAEMATRNLRERFGADKSVEEFVVKLNFEYGRDLRDISAMDVARWLETDEGHQAFVAQVKSHVKADTAIVLPPVLGLEPNYEVLDSLQKELGCPLVEMSSLPPAVTGTRLNKMLHSYAKKHGVQIIEKARVVGSEIVDGKCLAVITEGFDRQRKFYADQFILATGGVYGGGITTQIGTMTEPIFNISIKVPEVQTDWSYKQLFADKKQIFAQYGVKVDENLTPVAADGSKPASNVKVAGRSLAGYDFCYEKSGNGVALITAYKAAAAFCGEA